MILGKRTLKSGKRIGVEKTCLYFFQYLLIKNEKKNPTINMNTSPPQDSLRKTLKKINKNGKKFKRNEARMVARLLPQPPPLPWEAKHSAPSIQKLPRGPCSIACVMKEGNFSFPFARCCDTHDRCIEIPLFNKFSNFFM